LNLAEKWGISAKAARRLRAMKLDEAALAVMVNDVKRTTAAQRERTGRRGYLGGMKALGMRSRIPGIVKLVAR
jgi:hypothetical protein